jgi:hypothetical protein
VSKSKPVLSSVPKRKPYNRPTVTKLTPEEAKAVLEAKGIPGNEEARQLLEAIRLRLGEKK